MKLNPYLMFNGNCEAAFQFYAECLSGKIDTIHRYEGSPMAEKLPSEWREKSLSAARLLVGERVVMGSDTPPDRYEPPKGFSMSLDFDSVPDAERIFAALAENGNVQMPMQKTFWAARFGMLVDQFGVPWMVNCEQPG